MEILHQLNSIGAIDIYSISIRLGLSLLLGGLIGWEREYRRQPAGLRTHILICLGATLMMLISVYIPQTYSGGDPSRIAAQVVSGIGFLGAGAIFSLGGSIRGLTTAASIWIVAAIGLAVGAGMYLGAIFATVLVLLVLILFRYIAKHLFQEEVMKILKITFSSTKVESEKIFLILEQYKIVTQSVNVHQSKSKKKTRMELYVQMPIRTPIKDLYKDLYNIHHVVGISLGQDFK
jgi:putative Mg2+ transporter-C (MgtC) family protein